MKNVRGTARDPDLQPRLIRLRFEVLSLLRGVGRDYRGTGRSLSTGELAGLLKNLPLEEGDDVGQAARWFSLGPDDAPEHVLYWVNGTPARFGLRRERTDAEVDAVLAGYAGRLAAFALAREEEEVDLDAAEVGRRIRELQGGGDWGDRRGPDADTEEGAPGGPPYEETADVESERVADGRGCAHVETPELDRGDPPPERPFREIYGRDALADSSVMPPGQPRQADLGMQMQNRPDSGSADADLRQFGQKRAVDTSYDSAKVRAFVGAFRERVVGRVVRGGVLQRIAALLKVHPGLDDGPPSPSSSYPEEWKFAGLSPWEKNNALFLLMADAEEEIRLRAEDWACHADPARRPRRKL